ncbi:tyrosine-type recombinase/integrase [Salinisphaera hydrothermalis]|uniref:tyrosine-type recombinase/integrase n=1 Tax=Salinisphaera hydrothermalis TaxID=563188 RepID=UPI003341E0E7
MGRRRSARFRHLPDNLEPDPRRNATYYRYKMPDGRRVPMGKDEAAAIDAAVALNLKFRREASNLVEKALAQPKSSTRNPDFGQLLDEYEKHLRGRGLAKGTVDGKLIKLREYRERWANRTVQEFETIDISGLLKEKPHHAYGKHRVLLCDLFQFASHQGYRDDNPAARTLEKRGKAPQKERQRHTREGYCATYEAADPWLQRAMGIALYSLQRRQDLCALHVDAVDLKRGTFRVFQQKSRNYQRPVYIEIEMGPELLEVVRACVHSDVPCPYLLHRRPVRIQKRDREAKPHPFALTLDYLSKAFSAARDKAGAYNHLPLNQRPTLHELRALGIHLYREAGFEDEYIGALSGHAGKKMIDHYAKDHEERKPVFVQAGLSLTSLDPI